MTEKGKFLQKINEAFAKSDIDFLQANTTEDITWNIIGDRYIKGKNSFLNAVKEMEGTAPLQQIEISNIITHGDSAAVNGNIKTTENKENTYAFCSIYKFSGFKNPKVKAITTYVIDLKI